MDGELVSAPFMGNRRMTIYALVEPGREDAVAQVTEERYDEPPDGVLAYCVVDGDTVLTLAATHREHRRQGLMSELLIAVLGSVRELGLADAQPEMAHLVRSLAQKGVIQLTQTEADSDSDYDLAPDATIRLASRDAQDFVRQALEIEAADTATQQAFERRSRVWKAMQSMDPRDPAYEDLRREWESLGGAANQYAEQVTTAAKAVDWDEVSAIAEDVRASIHGGNIPAWQCRPLSEKLVETLRSVGYDAKLACGYFLFGDEGPEEEGLQKHCWVELDGRIVDITADQFNGINGVSMPPVFIGDADDEAYRRVPYASRGGSTKQADLVQPGQRVLLHGTTLANAQKIVEQGLLPMRGKWTSNWHGKGAPLSPDEVPVGDDDARRDHLLDEMLGHPEGSPERQRVQERLRSFGGLPAQRCDACGQMSLVRRGREYNCTSCGHSNVDEAVRLPAPKPQVPPLGAEASGRKEKDPALLRENELIAENKKKPKAGEPHEFRRAEWTHPNGHPRCLDCGGEERIGGWCNKEPSAEDMAEFQAELDREFGTTEASAFVREALGVPGDSFHIDPEALGQIEEHNAKLWEGAVRAMALKALSLLDGEGEAAAALAVAEAYGADVSEVRATPVMSAVLDRVLEWARQPERRAALGRKTEEA